MNLINKDNTGLLRSNRGSLYCYWGIAAIMAILYSLLSYLTPLYLDDWSFMAVWRDDVNGGHTFSWKTWADYFHYIRGFDNGRIANALSPISTMFSPWKELFPIFTGIFLALSAVLIQFLAIGKRSAAALAAVWILMIVGLPWPDTIFVRDYSLNYIWATAINLIFLLSLKLVCRGRNLFVPTLLIAVLAGGWHESFAVTTLFGLGLLALSRRFCLPPKFYILTAVYLLSAVAFMLSPGLVNRAANALETEDQRIVFMRPLVIMAIDALLLGIYAILAISKNGLRNFATTFRRMLQSPAGIVAAGIVVSGFPLGFFAANTFRSYFWPDIAAIAIAILLLKKIYTLYPLRPVITRAAMASVVIICILQTTAALVWQAKYKKESDEIMTLLDRSKSGTVFYDIRMPRRAPFYTLGMPVSNAWYNPFHYHLLESYYMTPVIGVVPTRLRHATAQDMETGSVRLTKPEYTDGKLKIPFISEAGDTLIYTVPL